MSDTSFSAELDNSDFMSLNKYFLEAVENPSFIPSDEYFQELEDEPTSLTLEEQLQSELLKSGFQITDLGNVDTPDAAAAFLQDFEQARSMNEDDNQLSKSEEDELVAIAQSASADAISAFYKLCEPHIEKLKSRLRSHYYCFPENAEDIAHSSMQKAWKYFNTFKGESKFYTWLYRVNENMAKTYFENEDKYGNNYFKEDYHRNEENFGERAFLSPEDVLFEEQVNNLTDAARAQLSTKFKRTLILYWDQKLSYEEISETEGIPLNTVKSRIKRATEALFNIIKIGKINIEHKKEQEFPDEASVLGVYLKHGSLGDKERQRILEKWREENTKIPITEKEVLHLADILRQASNKHGDLRSIREAYDRLNDELLYGRPGLSGGESLQQLFDRHGVVDENIDFSKEQSLESGRLILDFYKKILIIDDHEVSLCESESLFLKAMFDNYGVPIPAQKIELFVQDMGYDYTAKAMQQAKDRIIKKLKLIGHDDLIICQKGSGYKISRLNSSLSTVKNLGRLSLNLTTKELLSNEANLTLSRRGYSLMNVLFDGLGKSVSISDIITKSSKYGSPLSEGGIRPEIKKINEALADMNEPPAIENMFGHGYGINSTNAKEQTTHDSGFTLCRDKKSLAFGDIRISLTKREYLFLDVLFDNPQTPQCSESIVDAIKSRGENITIASLRQAKAGIATKIKALGLPSFIVSLRNQGYILSSNQDNTEKPAVRDNVFKLPEKRNPILNFCGPPVRHLALG